MCVSKMYRNLVEGRHVHQCLLAQKWVYAIRFYKVKLQELENSPTNSKGTTERGGGKKGEINEIYCSLMLLYLIYWRQMEVVGA